MSRRARGAPCARTFLNLMPPGGASCPCRPVQDRKGTVQRRRQTRAHSWATDLLRMVGRERRPAERRMGSVANGRTAEMR